MKFSTHTLYSGVFNVIKYIVYSNNTVNEDKSGKIYKFYRNLMGGCM